MSLLELFEEKIGKEIDACRVELAKEGNKSALRRVRKMLLKVQKEIIPFKKATI